MPLRRFFTEGRRRNGVAPDESSSDLCDRLIAGAVIGGALGAAFFAVVGLIALVAYLAVGLEYVLEQRISIRGAALVLVIYPLAGMLAGVVLPLARGRAGRILVATLLVLPFGIGTALVEGGVDRYGNGSWGAALIVSLFFGFVFGTGWWRSEQ